MSPLSKANLTFSKREGSFWASSITAFPTLLGQEAVDMPRIVSRFSGASRLIYRRSGYFRRAKVVFPVCLAPVRRTRRFFFELGRVSPKIRYFCIISLMVVNITAYFTMCQDKIKIIFKRGFVIVVPKDEGVNKPVL